MINPASMSGKGLLASQANPKEATRDLQQSEKPSAHVDDFGASNVKAKQEVKESKDVRIKETPVRASGSPQSAKSVSKEDTFKKSLKTAIKEKGISAPGSKPPASKINPPETDSAPVEDLNDESEYIGVVSNAQLQDSGAIKNVQQDEVPTTKGEVTAVVKFMQSMEEEFGISAQQLVAAMAAAQTTIVQTPSQDVVIPAKEMFFEKLGLEGPQLKRAEFLYQNMLKEMAQESMANYLKETNREMDVQVIDPALLRKKEINRSIDRMSQTFFMNDTRPAYGKPDPNAVNPEMMQNISAKQSQKTDFQKTQKSQDGSQAGIAALPTGFEQVAPQQMAAPSVNPAASTAASIPTAMDVSQLSAMESSAVDVPDALPDTPTVKTTKETPMAAKAQAPSAVDASVASFAVAATPQFTGDNNSSLGPGKKESNANDFKEQVKVIDVKGSDAITESSAKPDAARVDASTFSVSQKPSEVPGAVGAAQTATDPRALDRPEDAMNVRSLIQNAQVLLRRGGGEMKVQMHPEGLGQVDMKVAVKDGKVDVQLFADTTDTKRLLEKNIHELKANLVQQKLDVSDVKVDMTKNTDKDLSNNGDQSREQARQFLGQFRDDREAMRQGMFELPSMRQYKQSSTNQIQPPEPASQQPASKGSKRLNVVV